MSSTKILLISILLAICPFVAMPADTPPASTTKPKVEKTGGAVLHKVYKSSLNKRSPSRVNIEIQYYDGGIVMYSDNPNECLTLEISNYATGEYVVISDLNSGEIREVELNCGQYDVTATNQESSSYQGILTIDYY